jgi:hypothetical protein
LNRSLTEVDWHEKALNQRRLDLLQRDSTTHYTPHGVIAIDNTLIDHDGKLIEDAGWFWDHADQRHLIAHDYLIANYVCASGKHYPLEFRRFRKQDTCVADGTPFKNHTVLCKELVDWVVEQAVPGDFTFDSYFTNAEILNHITSKNRNYVGDLKFNRTITVDGKDWKASDWVKTQLGPLCRRKTTVDGKEQWYFTKSTLCHCTAIYWDVTALLHPPDVVCSFYAAGCEGHRHSGAYCPSKSPPLGGVAVLSVVTRLRSRLGECLSRHLRSCSVPIAMCVKGVITMPRRRVRPSNLPPQLQQVKGNAAAIDIGSTSHFVAVPEGRDSVSVREFATFTADLHLLADWLQQCGIDTVVMESTGVYWIPVFELLEQRGSPSCWWMPASPKMSVGASRMCSLANGCSSSTPLGCCKARFAPPTRS